MAWAMGAMAGRFRSPPATASTARMISGRVMTDGDSWGWTFSASKRSGPWKVRPTMRQV